MPRRVREYGVADAAKALGMRRQNLENLLRSGDRQFGIYIPPEPQGKQGSYYVYRNRVEAYLNAEDLKCPYRTPTHTGLSI